MLLNSLRRVGVEDDGESSFVSMTDLTVSFLFIVLVLLAFFANQLEQEKEIEIQEIVKPEPQQDELAEYLKAATEARVHIVDMVAEHIRKHLRGEIEVIVDKAEGIIRFQGDDLFKSGQWRVHPESMAERVARALGNALIEVLPCYTIRQNAKSLKTCTEPVVLIETIKIEGHTDKVPVGSTLMAKESMVDNLDLSARRGAEMLRAVTGDQYKPELMLHKNLRGQPVLSFGGFGEHRPINPGEDESAHAKNRRIDIRFILHTPQNLREIEEFRSEFLKNRTNLPKTTPFEEFH